MEHELNSPILIPVFIILLLVIFPTVKNSFKLDGRAGLILSVCVSILSTLGINSFLLGQIVHPIQFPYAALGIFILLLLLIRLIASKTLEDWFWTIFKKDPPSDVDDKTNDDRTKR